MKVILHLPTWWHEYKYIDDLSTIPSMLLLQQWFFLFMMTVFNIQCKISLGNTVAWWSFIGNRIYWSVGRKSMVFFSGRRKIPCSNFYHYHKTYAHFTRFSLGWQQSSLVVPSSLVLVFQLPQYYYYLLVCESSLPVVFS